MNQTELPHVNFPHLRDLKPFDTAHSATPWLNSPDEKHTRKLCGVFSEKMNRQISNLARNSHLSLLPILAICAGLHALVLRRQSTDPDGPKKSR